MRTTNPEEIEFIRIHIENLSFPIYSEQKEKNLLKNKTNNKKKQKKQKQEKEEDKDLIDKNFNEIYELYNNDIEYKKELEKIERLKSLKISKIDSFQCRGKASEETKFINLKFNIKDCSKIFEKNNHHTRNETIYEDDFSSSDSYESDLFDFKKKVPKNPRLKTKQDFYDNEDNLMEIMKVLNLNQK